MEEEEPSEDSGQEEKEDGGNEWAEEEEEEECGEEGEEEWAEEWEEEGELDGSDGGSPRAPRLPREEPLDANLTIEERGGVIKWYNRRHGQPAKFIAFCPKHAGCTMQGQSEPGAREGTGRPIGTLLAFLADAENHSYKFEHKACADYTHAIREDLRRGFVERRGEEFTAIAMLAKERPQAITEPSPEPEVQPTRAVLR